MWRGGCLLLLLALGVSSEASAQMSPERQAVLEHADKCLIRPIPKNAALKHFVFTDGRVVGDPKTGPNKDREGKVYTSEVSGWIVEETEERYRVLDLSGNEDTIAKLGTTVTSVALDNLKSEVLALKEEFFDTKGKLALHGWPRSPRSRPSVVEFLASELFLRAGDELEALRLIGVVDDTVSFSNVVRDAFAREYDHQMLVAFSRRDYLRTTALAETLLRPEFDGYVEQPRARRLREQLLHRADDFVSFTLPSPDAWAQLRSGMSRPEQIRYLASRLRLLNCWQVMQPGGVDYECPQWSHPVAPRWSDEQGDVINPFEVLRQMQLTPSDLEVLAPFLADESYLPSFSFQRDFMVRRMLHQVGFTVAELIDQATSHGIPAVKEFWKVDSAEKPARVAAVVAWCRAHEGRTREQLILETLRTTTSYDLFWAAARDAEELNLREALPILAARHRDFQSANLGDGVDDRTMSGVIAHFVYRLRSEAEVPLARAWLKDPDRRTRFWAALLLLDKGDRERLEGLAELKAAMDEETRWGDDLSPAAIDPLLALKRPEAMLVAESVMNHRRFSVEHERWGILQHLSFAGSARARDYLRHELEDETPLSMGIDGIRAGEPAGRVELEKDQAGIWISEWMHGRFEYDKHASEAERAAQLARIRAWLEAEWARVDAGGKTTAEMEPLTVAD